MKILFAYFIPMYILKMARDPSEQLKAEMVQNIDWHNVRALAEDVLSLTG